MLKSSWPPADGAKILSLAAADRISLVMLKQFTQTELSARDNPRRAEEESQTQSGPSTVAGLAYQLWLERGSPYGSPDEDWFRAESLLRAESRVHASPAAA